MKWTVLLYFIWWDVVKIDEKIFLTFDEEPVKEVLREIRAKFQSLPSEQSALLRDRYISQFINVDAQYYKKYYLNQIGYLWDIIKRKYEQRYVHETYIINQATLNGERLFFWDGTTPLQRHVGKTTIFQADLRQILNNLEILPLDMYILDETLEWTIIRTHEDMTLNGDHVPLLPTLCHQGVRSPSSPNQGHSLSSPRVVAHPSCWSPSSAHRSDHGSSEPLPDCRAQT